MKSTVPEGLEEKLVVLLLFRLSVELELRAVIAAKDADGDQADRERDDDENIDGLEHEQLLE